MKQLREKIDHLTLLELFWTEPKIANPEDGYWCYETQDEAGTIIRFGMDIIQESVQIDLQVADNSLLIFTYELVESLEIIDRESGKFAFTVAPKINEIKTRIEIELRPCLKIQGYTLRNDY
ncbi:MAG: hypothetical protein SAL07_24150 [Oscillatoria sp. PMC 1051.18]|nr:hypothetical protein [Oscillatoria sp. PMC 1050.18]MEC5033003.1 hypothetical protein [Oscillatoria sp. PMC 1051.18]